MDELNIVSKFMCKILSKIIEKNLKKNGYNMNIRFNNLNATISDKVHLHISTDIEMTKDELLKIITGKIDE